MSSFNDSSFAMLALNILLSMSSFLSPIGIGLDTTILLSGAASCKDLNTFTKSDTLFSADSSCLISFIPVCTIIRLASLTWLSTLLTS